MGLQEFIEEVFALFFLVVLTYAFYSVFGALPGGFWYGVLFLLMMIVIGIALVLKIIGDIWNAIQGV